MPASPVKSTSGQSVQFTMDDDALVKLDIAHMTGTTATFTDQGFMQVNLATLMSGGNPLHVPGGLDGAFIRYTGTGTQDFATGEIKYSTLSYTIEGYKGHPSFSTPTTDYPTVTGKFKDVVLAHGTLDTTQTEVLNFANGVHGTLHVSVLAGLTGTQSLGKMDITVDHATFGASQFVNSAIGPLPSLITLQGPSLQAKFMPTAQS